MEYVELRLSPAEWKMKIKIRDWRLIFLISIEIPQLKLKIPNED